MQPIADDYPDIYPDSQPERTSRLAVYDFATQRVVDTCVPSDVNLDAPVWLMDSRYILSEDYYDNGNPSRGHVYLTDLSKGKTSIFMDDVSPVGWMKPAE